MHATLWTNCQIFTLIYSRPERREEEHTERFISVTENDLEKLIEGEEGQQRRERRWNFGQNKAEGKPLASSKAPGLR